MKSDKNGKLCVLLPTMNRAQCIKGILEDAVEYVDKLKIDYFIYDTSTDESTKVIVEEFNKKTDNRFQYYKHENYPDRTTDLKIINAFKMLQDHYDYIWLSGDGCILKIKKMLDIAGTLMENKFDVIHFTDEDYLDKDEIVYYENPALLFKDHADFMTYYSATILSTSFIKNVSWEMIGREFRNSGFLYWKGIFEGLVLDVYKTAVINRKNYIENPYKNGNSSYSPGKFLRFWAKNWPQAVYSLPGVYDIYKKEVCKGFGKYHKLYELTNLITLRMTGNLNKELYEQYENYLPEVTDVSLKKIYFVAAMPSFLLFFCKVWFFIKYRFLVK